MKTSRYTALFILAILLVGAFGIQPASAAPFTVNFASDGTETYQIVPGFNPGNLTPTSGAAVVIPQKDIEWGDAIAGSSWITYAHSGDVLSGPLNGTIIKFTKTITVNGTPTGGTVSVMADDSASVDVNGTRIIVGTTNDSFSPHCASVGVSCHTPTTVSIPANLLHAGVNTIDFSVNQQMLGLTYEYSSYGVDFKGSITAEQQQLSCSSQPQSAAQNTTVNFSAVGGTGSYSWSLANGNPSSGTGSVFSTQLSVSGVQTATVTSGTQSAQCSVQITQPVCVAPQVQTLAATNIAQNSATIVGSVVANGTSSISYFEYGTSISLGYATPSRQTGSSQSQFTEPLTSLSQNTTYYFRMVSRTNCGTTYGSIQSFTTTNPQIIPPACVAPEVQTFSASSITQNGALLNGYVGTSNVSGQPTTYHFEYGTSPSLGYSTQTQSTNWPMNVSASANSLIQNTTYYFRLVGQNNCGTTYGSIQSFTTTGNQSYAATLYCSAQSQNVSVNDLVNFYASGDYGNNLSWYASDGSPVNGYGTSNFSTRFSTSGTKTIVVTSGSNTAQCTVYVNAPTVQNNNFSITKTAFNRTLNQGQFASFVEGQGGDIVEFEIRVRNYGFTSTPLMLRDVLPSELNYILGTTQINGVLVADGILSGISLGTLTPNEEKIVRLQTSIVPGTSNRTITNQTQATMGSLTQTAFATIQIRSRGQVLGAADIVTGPEDVVPLSLLIGLLGSSLAYYFFFFRNQRKTSAIYSRGQGVTFLKMAPIAPRTLTADEMRHNEVEDMIRKIREEEGKPDTSSY